MRSALVLAALLGCSSCSVIEQPSGLIARWTTAWKDVATTDDRQRLMEWRSTFVAALALFLCRDEAASITGANLSMDGGWTAA